MYQVIKRDGATVDFDISKISAAMTKAFDAVGRQYHPSVINMLALQVSADYESKIKEFFLSQLFNDFHHVNGISSSFSSSSKSCFLPSQK